MNKIPPELSRSTPRHVAMNSSGVATLVFAILLVAAALAAAIAFARQTAPPDSALVAARAAITEIEIVEGQRRRISYRYQVDGEDHTGRVTLHRGDHRPMSVGGSISIRYLKRDHGKDWAVGYGPRPIPAPLMILLPLGLVAVAVMIRVGMARQRTLLAEGRAVMGRVVASRKPTRVEFEFTLLNGSVMKSVYSVEDSKTAPAAGMPLVIVYSKDTPKRHARYPFSLYKAL